MYTNTQLRIQIHNYVHTYTTIYTNTPLDTSRGGLTKMEPGWGQRRDMEEEENGKVGDHMVEKVKAISKWNVEIIASPTSFNTPLSQFPHPTLRKEKSYGEGNKKGNNNYVLSCCVCLCLRPECNLRRFSIWAPATDARTTISMGSVKITMSLANKGWRAVCTSQTKPMLMIAVIG